MENRSPKTYSQLSIGLDHAPESEVSLSFENFVTISNFLTFQFSMEICVELLRIGKNDLEKLVFLHSLSILVNVKLQFVPIGSKFVVLFKTNAKLVLCFIIMYLVILEKSFILESAMKTENFSKIVSKNQKNLRQKSFQEVVLKIL